MVGEQEGGEARLSRSNFRELMNMGLLGKIIVRIVFSVTIVALIIFEVLKTTTIADMFNSALLIFAIISTDILMERYLSRGEDDVE